MMSADLVGLFAELWKSQSDEADVRIFLEQHPGADREQRFAVVLYDQRHRWKIAKPRTAEEYFSEFPELHLDSSVKLMLIVSEFQACRECGGSIAAQELIARFPELNAEIQRELSRLDPTCDLPAPRIAINSFYSGSTQTEHHTIGSHRLLELIGEGGFGQVWLAWDQDLKRKVAVKLARPNRLPGPEDKESLLEEARLLAGLKHPNIVGVLGVGRSDERLGIVFEFIDGQDLAKVLKTRVLEFREAAELIATVATALHYA